MAPLNSRRAILTLVLLSRVVLGDDLLNFATYFLNKNDPFETSPDSTFVGTMSNSWNLHFQRKC